MTAPTRRAPPSGRASAVELVAGRAVRGEQVHVRPVVGELALERRDPRLGLARSRPRRARARDGCRRFGGGRSQLARLLRRLGRRAPLARLAARTRSAQPPSYERRRPILDGDDAVGDGVEQRAVVRDEQHRAGERLERGLERLAALEVEVVRRLVEDEEVRPRRDERARARAAAARPRERRRPASRASPSRRRGSGRAATAPAVAAAPSPRPRSRAPSRARGSSACAARSTPGTTPCPSRADPPSSGSRGRGSSRAASSCRLPFGPTSATCSPRSSASDASSQQRLVAGRERDALGLQDDPARARRLEELEAERPAPLR